jgi:hypothetical protein
VRTCVVHTLHYKTHVAPEIAGASRTGSTGSNVSGTALKGRINSIVAGRTSDFLHSPFIGAACLLAFVIIAIVKPFSTRHSVDSARPRRIDSGCE